MRHTILIIALALGFISTRARADEPCPDLVISEFMAKNVHGIKDVDGTPQDWIEIFNPCRPSVELNGWYLTDDATNLAKWQFPAVTLDRNQFLLVFASGKNRAVAGEELHANFLLDAGGEYLALVRPDGVTIEQEFAPKYPDQYLDVSYGSPQAFYALVPEQANCVYQVPQASDESLGESWASEAFDAAAWSNGQFGLGFLTSSASQFDVTYYKANINVNNLATAETVISDPTKRTNVIFVQAPFINYLNTASGAHFGSDLPFPGTTIGVNVDDFVVLVAGSIVIPTAGNWTFGVNSDDGFGLQLTNGTSTFNSSFPGTRGTGDTLATFNVTEPGAYQVRLVFFERGGGSALEFFAAQGSFSSYSQSAFRLVGDVSNGGLPVVGFGNDAHTDVQSAMMGNNASIWTRTSFNVDNVSPLTSLTLSARYEDGYAAYLNGVLVAAVNSPSTPEWDSTAVANRPIASAYDSEFIDLTSHLALLHNGTNVLAIQGMNDAVSDTDFLIHPSLFAAAGQIDPGVRRYFTTPTPGDYNNAGYPDFAGKVHYSVDGGMFETAFDVSIATNAPTASIRYTLNGSVPTETNGFDYTGPINISATTRLRARAFDPGLAPGPVLSRHYVKLDATASSFSSDIPVVVLENFNVGQAGADIYQSAYMTFFEPGGDGRTRLTSVPVIESRAGIRIRGSSTESQPKHNYRVETWDEDGEDIDIAPFGMPNESDWILYAPYSFDRAFIRNAFVYALSNQMGRYAVRTRLVEMYLNIDGGALQASDNQGVYVFMESIKGGPDRVDITSLEPTDVTEPDVTGGWMLKIDRADPGEIGFSAAGQTIRYVEPDEEYVLDSQATWLTGYVNAFGTALNGAGFADPVNGYAKYIDVDSWIDQHILNVLTKNVDGLRLSTYMYMDRQGKVEMGPAWDFDRSMDSYDNRDDAYDTWNGLPDATDFWGYIWWSRLFQDPDFKQKWIDRWDQLRQNEFTTTNMDGIIDGLAGQVQEASVRNYAKWPGVGPAGGVYQNEVDNMKTWLANRVNWIDTQFTAKPSFSHAPGQVPFGLDLELTAPAGTIYYTLDGTDPRLPGGAVSGSAIAYSSPISVTSPTHVRARALNVAAWSAPIDGQFVLEFAANPEVVINEVMYAPAGVGAREFVELYNRSTSGAVDLSGWSVAGAGIVFPPGTILPPGAYGVIVEDLPTFQATYGTGILVLGDYTGQLNNGGELLVLLDQSGHERGRFLYDDAAPWPAAANGGGASLELMDSSHDIDRVGNWAASIPAGGTPGAPNSRAMSIPLLPRVVLNELLPTNTSLNTDEQGDHEPWIEIYNPDPVAVSLDGLYLTGNYALPQAWAIPNGYTLCQGEHLLIWADNEPSEGPLHAAFRPGASTGQIGLYGSTGLVIDYLNYAAIPGNVGYGRFPDGDGATHSLPIPTPGEVNAGGTSPLILNEYNGVSSSKFLKDNAADAYWGRILGNGGDWFELVVTQDHLDIRGWQLEITDAAGLAGQDTEIQTLTADPIWSDLRSGTIITVSEDLADDVSYNPQAGDWWINVRASASGTGQYITASNFPVSNDNWQLVIRNAEGNVVFGPAGEGIQPASGIGNDEICKLEDDPSPFVIPRSNYQDGSSSTFGSPNIYSGGTLVQNFDALRNVVQLCGDAGECDDGNPCTLDDCSGGECTHTAISPCFALTMNSSAASAGLIDACVGESIDISIDAAGLSVTTEGARILLSYDPSRLQFEGMDPGDGGASPWTLATIDSVSDVGGVIDAGLTLAGGTTSTGAVATLHFIALPAGIGSPDTFIQFATGCAPAVNSLSIVGGDVIRPQPSSMLAIRTGRCVSTQITIPGLAGTVEEGELVATRQVEFTLTACGGPTHDVRTMPVAFHRSGTAGVGIATLRNVEPSTTSIAIRESHTLRRRAALDLSSGDASVQVSLVAGDLQAPGVPQDGIIDIVDFAILASRWNTSVAECVGGLPADCFFGADVTGDGIQGTADFAVIQMNFFAASDSDDDCGPPGIIEPVPLPGLPNDNMESKPMPALPKRKPNSPIDARITP